MHIANFDITPTHDIELLESVCNFVFACGPSETNH